MHENEVPFINDGEHIEWAPEISIAVSLSVIVGTLLITTVASLIASSRETSDERHRHTGPRREFHHEHHESHPPKH
jgi:tellurite resistance protein TerC